MTLWFCGFPVLDLCKCVSVGLLGCGSSFNKSDMLFDHLFGRFFVFACHFALLILAIISAASFLNSAVEGFFGACSVMGFWSAGLCSTAVRLCSFGLEYKAVVGLSEGLFHLPLQYKGPAVCLVDEDAKDLEVGVHPFFDLLDDIEQVGHPLK